MFFLSFLVHLSSVVLKAQIDSGYKISKAIDFHPLFFRLDYYTDGLTVLRFTVCFVGFWSEKNENIGNQRLASSAKSLPDMASKE